MLTHVSIFLFSFLFVYPMCYYTYILSNFARTTFYIGVTNNLELRLLQHRNGSGGMFTSKYKCYYLMYYEEYANIDEAISREKNLKNWHREWKINLIRKDNPDLKDLSESWFR
jgi:putative endonuclease